MTADEKSTLWKAIKNLDFSTVKEKLKYKKGFWWRCWHNVDRLELEYKQFMFLIGSNPGKTIVPWTQELDDFWHEHILDTAKYTSDCQIIAGKYIHHNPHLPVGSANQQLAFAETKVLYKNAFEKKAKETKRGHVSDSSGVGCGGAGCGGVMPIVFCSTASVSCSSAATSHSHDSGGGSSCGGSGCGGSGCGGGGGCGGGCGGD
jgi:hypothetical protein